MVQQNSPITFGKQIGKLEIAGFVLTETFHDAHLTLAPHDHECANINFNLAGSFRETFGNSSLDSIPSSLLVKPAGERHTNSYGKTGAHSLVIEIKPARLQAVQHHSKLFDAPSHIHHKTLARLFRRIYSEFQTGRAASELMIEGLILEMLAEYTRRKIETTSSATPPRRIREARDFIAANFTSGISLSAVASTVGINPTYLARLFRKFYGCSIGDYVRNLQTEFACGQLLKNDHSLAEISLAAGFYDQSHFTNIFKIQIGMTPAEFRALYLPV